MPTSTTKSVADPRVLFGLSIRGSTLCSRNAPGRCNGDGCCESSLHDASLAPAERRGNRGCKQYIIERFRRENYDIIVLTYVDYCIILARDKGTITKFIATLRLGPEKFDFTDEGTLDKYLGVEVQRQPKGFSMSQPFLIERIITAANIDARMTNPKATPGMLGYLQNTTRPDIALNATRNFLRQNLACRECVAFVQLLLSRDNAGPERTCGCNFGHLAGCLSFAFIADQSSTFMHLMSEAAQFYGNSLKTLHLLSATNPFAIVAGRPPSTMHFALSHM